MTAVIFKFQQPSGDPVVGAPFTVTLRKPTFDEMDENGILLPGAIEGITDAQGECTLELAPGYGTYYLSMMVPGEQETPEGCIGGLRYKFIVPESPTPVRVEDLIVTVPTWSRPWDEQALLLITEAKVASQAAAVAAEASAVRADAAAESIEGDADRAEAARDAAEASKNAAAGSAQASANSAAASSQSADAALASKNAAANSANAANNSAVSANGAADRASASETAANASKNAAAGSATAASGSATTATNAATSATASKDAAAISATTATTKASEASTSAGNALTQADRAKTEADRATAATDGKQDKNTNLTALAGVNNAAINRFPIWTSANTMTSYVMSEYSINLLSLGNKAAYKSELGYASKGANDDITSISGLTTALSIAQGGTGANSAANARQNLGLVRVTSKTDQTANSLLTTGYAGIGAMLDGRAYLDNNSTSAAQGTGTKFFFARGGSDGFNIPGLAANVYGVGIEHGQWSDPSGDAGIQRQFWGSNVIGFQSNVSGAWSTWKTVFHTGNVGLDPALGGIMQSSIVSGFIITKFYSGEMLVRGIAGQTAAYAANESRVHTVTLPVALVNGTVGYGFAGMSKVQPTFNYDHYGVISESLSTSTTIDIVIRNGASPQSFELRVCVWGRWK